MHACRSTLEDPTKLGGGLFVLAFGFVVALLWRRDKTVPPLPPSLSDAPLAA